ncbi:MULTISPECIES: ABC transporter permease [Ensifer]|jgi:peptide/nickel transport system permease protein|uniref:ABC transporter permease subunit n=1 Tax=Ensifer canadensis TaxID=555315 RepID=A0AAW4FQ62_9HYPH|nr:MULTISPECIES: ABC transporter permease [Ensifer]AHK46394.1 putative peptide ABC transporter permease y4tP [Ensifer adhaerens OV14]MDP9633133.1 peptide/nickel transport system permease protein [Ensifer adhaerens]KQU94605.1 peptide ABC transporter permease [Ensifer sp. Root31]KQW61333.1 peptide ABC transporter permease [Ensifer sp. Root1252]KQW82800.1 peptide ABC transporter permease [Ensifer sp. Root127]
MRLPRRRLAVYCVAFLFAIVMNFAVPRLMPGSPVDSMIAQLGPRATPAAIEAIKARFGAIEQPMWQQFVDYIVGLAHFDLGVSVKYYPQTVLEVLGRSAGWTAFLVVTAIVFSLSIGVSLGALAAWRRGGRFDSFVSPFSVVMIAVPPVIIALATLFIFGVTLRLLPVGYAYDPSLDPGFNFTYFGSVFLHAIMPVLTLSPYLIGEFQTTMRSSMISVLGEDYVTMGRAKGLSESAVMFGYAARNAMLPVLTNLALMLGAVFGGSIVTEIVFNYPGLGLTLYTASVARDYPVIQGQLLLMTMATLGANLLVDILYGVVDPRIREGRA